MKKKSIIFGANDFGKMLRFYVEKYSDIEIVAFTMDKAYITEETYQSLPVVAFEDVENIYPCEEYTMFIAAGYSKMNAIRQQKFEEAKEKGYIIENFIHPSVVNDAIEIGEGNIIFENVTLAYGVKIGNANIIWNGAQISHESEVGDYNFFSGVCLIAGKTIVKNNCFLGINCAVQGSRTLEDFTLIGAGCFMKENSKKYGVYVPARSICLENKKSIEMI